MSLAVSPHVRSYLLLIGLALVFAALPLTETADPTTHRVLQQVVDIPWSKFFRPFDSPPPMEAAGIRPMSVFLLKLYEEGFGAVAAPPLWVSFLRSAFILGLFGTGALAFLRSAGLERVALPAALLSMSLSPTLFSAWYFPEFDTLGAGATLWVGALLAGAPLSTGTWAALLAVGSISFGLKESSVLMQFAFLGGAILYHFQAKERVLAERHLVAATVGTVLWMGLVAPLVRGGSSPMTKVSWLDRLPILEHNLAQLVYLLGAPGVMLLVVAAWPRRGVVAAAVLGLLLCPVVVFYSHYEAIYYAPRLFPMIGGALLVASLIVLSRRYTRLVLIIGVAYGLYSLAVMFSPTAREDLASRIFLALAPLLHALALEGVRLAWQQGSGLLLAGQVWYALASSFNLYQDWRAQKPVEFQGRRELAQIRLDQAYVLYNHYVELVGPYELLQFGTPDLRGSTRFVQITAFPDHGRLPDAFWGGRLALEDLRAAGTPIYVYWFAARSQMSPEVNNALVGDLSWTRRSYGLFTPYDYLPNPPEHIPVEHRPSLNGAPSHNRPEEMRMTTYHTGPTPLQVVAAEGGQPLWSSEASFYQLPLHLFELPRRLVTGLPIVERYAYEGSIYRLTR